MSAWTTSLSKVRSRPEQWQRRGQGNIQLFTISVPRRARCAVAHNQRLAPAGGSPAGPRMCVQASYVPSTTACCRCRQCGTLHRRHHLTPAASRLAGPAGPRGGPSRTATACPRPAASRRQTRRARWHGRQGPPAQVGCRVSRLGGPVNTACQHPNGQQLACTTPPTGLSHTHLHQRHPVADGRLAVPAAVLSYEHSAAALEAVGEGAGLWNGPAGSGRDCLRSEGADGVLSMRHEPCTRVRLLAAIAGRRGHTTTQAPQCAAVQALPPPPYACACRQHAHKR